MTAGPAQTVHVKAIGLVIVLLAASRLLWWMAPTARWTDQILHTASLGGALRTFLQTPVDFLLTMALLAALLVLAFDLTERLRRRIRRRQPPPATQHDWAVFAIT